MAVLLTRAALISLFAAALLTAPIAHTQPTVIAEIPVGSGPVYAVYNPSNGYIYVLNMLNNTVSIISGTSVIAEVGVGLWPIHAVYNPSNGYIYVLNMFGNSVSVISGTSVIATLRVGLWPIHAVYNPSDGYIYVVNKLSNTVSVISGTSVIAEIRVGKEPVYAIYNPSNEYVYVLNSGDNSTSVISGTSVLATVPVGGGPKYAVYNPLNGYIYVFNADGTVSVISGTSVIATIPLIKSIPERPTRPVSFNAVYNPSNGYVYVVDSLNDSISVISGTSVIAIIPVGSYPVEAIYNPLDGYIYVLNFFGRTISVISGTSVITTIRLSREPAEAVYNPSNGYIYVLHSSISDGAVSVIAWMYRVVFVANGLPQGAGWSVTLNGQTKSSTNNTIVFIVPPGRYQYTVNAPFGFYASPQSGVVEVKGDVSVAVEFRRVLYTVTFIADGLPSGAVWSVTLNGQTKSSTTNIITFDVPPGTYQYTVNAPSGYTATPGGGTITVSSDSTVNVAFTQIKYRVAFMASGLPSGVEWGVVLTSQSFSESKSSTADVVVFDVPSGTYTYVVKAPEGYRASPNNGTVTVANSPVTVQITFTPVTNTVTFKASGLPPGVLWSVTLDGQTNSSASDKITFAVPAGVYQYVVNAPSGYTATPSGDVITVSSDTTVYITFTPTVYTVTFIAIGLPSGAEWSVTLDGTTVSSSTNTIAFSAPFGTYQYIVKAPFGYSPSPSSGVIYVSKDVTVQIVFTPTFSSFFVLAVIIAVGAAGGSLLLLRRRSRGKRPVARGEETIVRGAEGEHVELLDYEEGTKTYVDEKRKK